MKGAPMSYHLPLTNDTDYTACDITIIRKNIILKISIIIYLIVGIGGA